MDELNTEHRDATEHKDGQPPVSKSKWTRKEMVRKITTSTALCLIEILQCTTACLVFKNPDKMDLFLASSLLVTYCLFFYRRKYFADIQPLSLTNYLFAFGLTTYVVEYDLNNLVSYIVLPIVSLALLALNIFKPEFNEFYPLVMSLNAFHQISKYSNTFKWTGLFASMAVYFVLQMFFFWKKRRLATYICKVINFYQMHSLLLDLILRAHGYITETHGRNIKGLFDIPPMFYANVVFCMAIVAVAVLKIPKTQKITERKEGSENSKEAMGNKNSNNMEEVIETIEETEIKITEPEEPTNFDVPTPKVSSYNDWSQSPEHQIDDSGFVANSQPLDENAAEDKEGVPESIL